MTAQLQTVAEKQRRLSMLKRRCEDVNLVLDDNQTAFLDRELRQVETQVFRKEYPALKHRLLIPTNNSIPRGAGSVSYRMLEQIRRAIIVSGGNAKDIPRVDVFASEFNQVLRPIASSFAYNVYELEQAAMAGFPIDSERAMACRDSIEYQLNYIAMFGDTANGLNGFLNNSNVPIVAAVASGGQTVWNNSGTIKATAGILADVTSLIRTIRDNTVGLYEPNTFVFGTPLMSVLRITPWSQSGGSDMTLLQYLQKNYPSYTFEESSDLDLANAGGTASRVVAYFKDPSVLDELIPGEYEQLPPQPQGMEFLNIGWAVTGGTRVRKPKAMAYLDGAA